MAGVDEGLGRSRLLEVVVVRVETADQAVEVERRFPDLEEQVAARTTASNASGAIDGGIVSLVLGAAAFELAGSDLQRKYISRIAGADRLNKRQTLAWRLRGEALVVVKRHCFHAKPQRSAESTKNSSMAFSRKARKGAKKTRRSG